MLHVINTVHFPSTECKEMALRGLKDLVSLFEMRIDEAAESGDVVALEVATNSLLIAKKTISAFEY